MRLGPYELISRIGAGGMGEVWAAHRSSVSTNEVFAVKRLPDSLARDPTYRRQLLDEARLSMLLRHRNIVHVIDAGESFGEAYIAMEFVQGLDLSRLRKLMDHTGEQLSPAIAAYVIGEVLEGLAYAHNLDHRGELISLIHRDVSPHNVMMSIHGEVKLTDFGVARLSSEDTSGTHVKGKARYMPPEQLRGESRSATVDLFAAGAVLHEMLDGRMFRHDAIDDARLLGMAIDGIVPPLGRRIVGALEDLRVGLLERDPQQRIHSAHAALELLHRWPGYADAAARAPAEIGALVRRYLEMQAALDGDPPPDLGNLATEPRTFGPSAGPSGQGIPIDLGAPGPSTSFDQLLGDDDFVAGEASLLEPEANNTASRRPVDELDGGFGPVEHIDYSQDTVARRTGPRPAVPVERDTPPSTGSRRAVPLELTSAADDASSHTSPNFTRHVATSPNPVVPNRLPIKLAGAGVVVLGLGVGTFFAAKQIGERPDKPTEATSPVEEGMRKVRVIGDELAGHAGFRTRNMDLLATEDILYSFIAADSNQRPLAALAAGEAEFALTTLDRVLLDRAQARPGDADQARGKIVAVIGLSFGRDALVLDTAEFSQLRSLADLDAFVSKSKREAVLAFANATPSASLDMQLANLLRSAAVPSVQHLGEFTDARAVFEALQAPADADKPVVGGVLSEPWLSQAVAAGMTPVVSTRDVPLALVNVLVASPRALEQPELVDTVVAAYYTGILAQQPRQASDLQAAIVRNMGVSEAEAAQALANSCLFDGLGAEAWMLERDGAEPHLARAIDLSWASLRASGRVDGLAPALAELVDTRATLAAAEQQRSAAATATGDLAHCLAASEPKAPPNQALGELALASDDPWFAPSSATLGPEAGERLSGLARRLAAFNRHSVAVEIVGHGDSAGGPNGKPLGQARAQAIVDALRAAGVELELRARGLAGRTPPPSLLSVNLSRAR